MMLSPMYLEFCIQTLEVSEIVGRIESISLKRKKGWKKNQQFRALLRDAQKAKIIVEIPDINLIARCKYETRIIIYHLFDLIHKKRHLNKDVKKKLKHLLSYTGKLLGHARTKFSNYKSPAVIILFKKSLQFSRNDSDDHLVSNLKKCSCNFFRRYLLEENIYEKGQFVG